MWHPILNGFCSLADKDCFPTGSLSSISSIEDECTESVPTDFYNFNGKQVTLFHHICSIPDRTSQIQQLLFLQIRFRRTQLMKQPRNLQGK